MASKRRSEDFTFSDDDIIRLYRNNLTRSEQAAVRQYFASEIFGGIEYFKRLALRIGQSYVAAVRAREPEFRDDAALEQFVQSLVERQIRRRHIEGLGEVT